MQREGEKGACNAISGRVGKEVPSGRSVGVTSTGKRKKEERGKSSSLATGGKEGKTSASVRKRTSTTPSSAHRGKKKKQEIGYQGADHLTLRGGREEFHHAHKSGFVIDRTGEKKGKGTSTVLWKKERLCVSPVPGRSRPSPHMGEKRRRKHPGGPFEWKRGKKKEKMVLHGPRGTLTAPNH